MNKKELEKKAEELRKQVGGTIFAFPIEEENPHSAYAVVVYAGGLYHVYPKCDDISFAALGVNTILEEMKKVGQATDFKTDVRLISYEAQMNAPDVRMARIKKEQQKATLTKDQLVAGVDVSPHPEMPGEYLFSARGLIKFSYLSMVDDKLPNAFQFMDGYYKLLAGKRYGKTAAAIKQEVKRMDKDGAIRWIERTFSRYVRDDSEVFGIMNGLNGG